MLNNKILISDPLEQFDALNVFTFWNTWYFSNIAIFLTFIYLIILIFFRLETTKFSKYIKTKRSNINILKSEIIFFIKNIISDNLNIKIFIYFPVIFTIFLFILISNFLGMVPYTYTVTSYFIITLFFSLSFFIGVNIIGFLTHGWELGNLFLPGGTPLPIAPFLVIIEIISYFARILSLSIRLFANMMSGHTLLKILIGFIWSFATSSFISGLIIIFPMSIIFILTFLELAIAFLQAYVFAVLLSIYLNDVINLH